MAIYVFIAFVFFSGIYVISLYQNSQFRYVNLILPHFRNISNALLPCDFENEEIFSRRKADDRREGIAKQMKADDMMKWGGWKTIYVSEQQN